MRIDHVAIWVQDLERMRIFYESYFNGRAGDLYVNEQKKFTSYFLSFDDRCRLELMHKSSIPSDKNDRIDQNIGMNHLAIAVGSKAKVNALTELLRKDGYKVIGEARTTGDGYYESVVFDPEMNRIEITV